MMMMQAKKLKKKELNKSNNLVVNSQLVSFKELCNLTIYNLTYKHI
jgi:hypothetical protein